MTKKPYTPKKEWYLSWPALIRNYRHDVGMSVAEFATYMKVSRQAVYFWENGERQAPNYVTQEVYDYQADIVKELIDEIAFADEVIEDLSDQLKKIGGAHD